ncbi:MAG: tetratricopeptide repeat protein [Betaproteobacteria bacterium]
MRVLLYVLMSTLVLASPVAQAQAQNHDQTTKALSDADPRLRREAASRLGEIGTMTDVALLARALRDADEDTRDKAQAAMWQIFGRSGDPDVDKLYQTGVRQMEAGDVTQSIATFTRVIERRPEFAEGWNKRATLYFMVGDLRKSLADCDEVIKRNPYHFGALAGYAQIYIRLEYYERALDYSRRALAVNPNMDGVKRNLQLLERLQEVRRRQMI